MKMSFGTGLFALAFICMLVIGCVDADKQKNISFISSYDNYKNICEKIGWEPKCRQQSIKGRSGKVIAFHAILSKRLTNVPSDVIIKFENVELNEGNGYNPNTGMFTAPMDGVYFFAWTYFTNKGSNAYLGGYVDGTLKSVVGTWDQSDPWQNISGHLVIKMKKRSQFWIQNIGSTTQVLERQQTFLSGYRISGC